MACRIVRNIPSPNGVVLDNDEEDIYLAVTRANAVWRLPFMADRTVARVGLFVQMSGGRGPDGLAMDANGDLIVAHPGFGSVWTFDRRGVPIAQIVSCEGLLTTNVAYGGPERRHLFITESHSGTILRAGMPHPGVAMFSGV